MAAKEKVLPWQLKRKSFPGSQRESPFLAAEEKGPPSDLESHG